VSEVTGRVAIVTGAGAGLGAVLLPHAAGSRRRVTVADMRRRACGIDRESHESGAGWAIMVTARRQRCHEIDALVDRP